MISGVALLLSAVSDVHTRRIPNYITLGGSCLVLVIYLLVAGFQGFLLSIAGLLVGLAMFLPMYVVGGMAAGDVKLVGFLGACYGVEIIIPVTLWIFIAGGVFALVYWLAAKNKLALSFFSFKDFFY